MHIHTNTIGTEPIAYFLWFGFGKKAAGIFCWIMAALISSLSIPLSLFFTLPLSLSPLFAYGFSFHLPYPRGMQAAQTFCAVCLQEFCVFVCAPPCLHACETFTSCVKGIYILDAFD